MWRCNNCGATNQDAFDVCSYCGYFRSREKSSGNTPVIVLLCVAVCLLLVLIFVLVSGGKEEASPSTGPGIVIQTPAEPVTPAEPEPTAPPASSAPATPAAPDYGVDIPDNPQTIYGLAMWNEAYGNVSYSTSEKLDIISDAYYARKDEKGLNSPGYSSHRNSDNYTGRPVGLYIADGIVYYSEVLSKDGKNIIVKLYFWGNELIGCRDYREDGSLVTSGSVFDNVKAEYGGVWALA